MLKTSDSASTVALESVWKKFRRGERHDSLRDLIPSTARRLLGRARGLELQDKEFWALRDVSFEARAGDALGIIGPNGAGKSTILKLLTRILRPSRGSCRVSGRVGALIEVAAGFHPDLTGRENIYLQGAIIGMRRAEIARKFDAIVAFAGIGEFIDTPVKRYSSGMNARLGFAIAAHLDPDVLLVDEVLAVGDAAFQEQCLGRMKELIRRGVTLVFISHNLPAVLDLCTRVVVLDRGSVVFDGGPSAGVMQYRSLRRAPASDPGNHDGIVILGVELLDHHQTNAAGFHTGGPMTIRVRYAAARPVQGPHFAIDVFRDDGVYCFGINSRMDGRDFGVLEGLGFVDLEIPHLWLVPGSYVISAGVLDSQGLQTLDVQHHGYQFSVMSSRRNLGIVYLERSWCHQRGVAPTLPPRSSEDTRRFHHTVIPQP